MLLSLNVLPSLGQNSQIYLVRVVRASYQSSRGMLYFLTLEAVDEGVAKVYQALVHSVLGGKVELKLFGLLDADTGSLLKLIFKKPTAPWPYEGLKDRRGNYLFYAILLCSLIME